MRSIRTQPYGLPRYLLPVLLAGLFAFAFLPGLDNQLVSDDWVFVYRGAEVDSLQEALLPPERGWFSRPVIWILSFGLARGFGTEAPVFHSASLLFHLANALLLGSLLSLLLAHWRTVETLSRPARRLVIWGAGAFFLFYPLHHEAVFWYASITELTALFGRLLLLHACVRSLYPPSDRPALRLAANGLVAGVGLALALASKESAAVLPGELFLLVVLGAWPWPGERWSSLLRPRFAWTLFSICSLVTLAWLLWYRTTRGFSVDQLRVLEAGPGEWILRGTQGVARAVLAGEIVRDPRLLSVAAVAGAAVFALAVRRGERLVLFGASWLVLCLLPYLAIGSVADHEAQVPILHRSIGVADDRYFYSAAAALALLVPALVLWLSKEATRLDRDLGTRALGCGLAVLLAAAAAGAWRLSRYERQWDAAGDLLDRTRLEIAAELPLPIEEGELVCVHSPPDSLEGRYVLRNGIAQLVWLHAGHRRFGVVVPRSSAPPACTRRLFLGD